MKPIIGIVARPFQEESTFPLMGIHEEYRKAIIEANGIPMVIVPNISYENSKKNRKMTHDEKEDFIRILDACDGILMTGGESFLPSDFIIYEYCLERKKPYLGICLGMQLMVGEENLTLMDSDFHNSLEKYVHFIKIEDNTKLKSIFKDFQIKVNSRHHDCVINPKQYRIGALSEDGIIEELELSDYPFHIGVAWHPESMIEYEEKMKSLFSAFIEAASHKMW